jgi:hypothetical protein
VNLTDYFLAFYKAFISPSKAKLSFSQYSEDLIIQSYFLRKKVVCIWMLVANIHEEVQTHLDFIRWAGPEF